MTDDEIVTFCRLLLPAGAQTTFRALANIFFALLDNPMQLAAVRADHALIPRAVEEGLRWEPPMLATGRMAADAAELEGMPVVPRLFGEHPVRRSQPRPFALERARTLRRAPRAQGSSRLRRRQPHLPRDQHGPHGDARRDRGGTRTIAGARPRPRRRRGPRSPGSAFAIPRRCRSFSTPLGEQVRVFITAMCGLERVDAPLETLPDHRPIAPAPAQATAVPNRLPMPKVMPAAATTMTS